MLPSGRVHPAEAKALLGPGSDEAHDLYLHVVAGRISVRFEPSEFDITRDERSAGLGG